MNLYEVFAATAQKQCAHAAIVGPNDNDAMTYEALDDAIGLAAAALHAAGVRQGDTIGLHCPSGAAYIILTYAVWKCGGCVVPIPTELTDAEKQEICREISLSFLISDKLKAKTAATQ